MSPRLDQGQIEVVDARIAKVLRRKSSSDRIAMIGAANRTARQLLAAGIRHHFSTWDAATVQQEVARRMLRGSTGITPICSRSSSRT